MIIIPPYVTRFRSAVPRHILPRCDPPRAKSVPERARPMNLLEQGNTVVLLVRLLPRSLLRCFSPTRSAFFKVCVLLTCTSLTEQPHPALVQYFSVLCLIFRADPLRRCRSSKVYLARAPLRPAYFTDGGSPPRFRLPEYPNTAASNTRISLFALFHTSSLI